MAREPIIPTGRERTFSPDDVIVSKTDPKGRLTYVNDVFLSVSGFPEAELLGAPHSLIRHPDMPRSVFALLWETIASGQEIFAYVVNLCLNGDHYWVFAHVTPTFDASGRITGYHSNRRTADRRAIAAAETAYAALRAEEARHPRKADAVAAGTALLAELVSEHGGYDAWVWSLEPEARS